MSPSRATSAMRARSSRVSTPPGRICRRVEDDQLRPRRHQADELVRVETEVVLLADRDRHRRRADEARHRLVDRKARVGVDDLVALLGQREDREEHDRLRARRHDHLRRVDGDAAPATLNRAAIASRSWGRPGGGRIVGPAGVERPLVGFDDVRRRVEVRLADLEVDHVAARRLERAGAGGRFEGGFGPEAGHPVGESHGHASYRRPTALWGG